jgi:hypothetical protein
VTLSNGREAPSDVAVQSAREGTKGSKRRCKKRPQGAMSRTEYDDGNNGKAGGSDIGCIMTAAHSDKRQACPPINHF